MVLLPHLVRTLREREDTLLLIRSVGRAIAILESLYISGEAEEEKQ